MTKRRRVTFVLLVLAVAALCVRLGFWQLDRARQKEALLEADTQQKQRADLDLTTADPTSYDARRKVYARGYFDGRYQLLLDNQVEQQRVGYHVLTPFRLQGDEARWVLVNRGWLPVGEDRRRLPDVSVGAQLREIRGQLMPAPGVGIKLGAPFGPETTWPRVTQYLDWDALTQLYATANSADTFPLLPYVIRLDADSLDGYQRQWRVLESGPEKHWGYAAQWFTLSGAMILLLGGVLWREYKKPSLTETID